ncbi:MAG TPA: type II secretion system F family protein [Armatimonadota bacterium]|jgi:tight adherence protein B
MVLFLVGAAILGVGAIGTLVWMWWSPRLHSQMRLASATLPSAGTVSALPTREKQKEWEVVSDRAALVSQLLHGLPWFDALQLGILQAGWLLRPSEFVAMLILSGLTMAAVLMLLTKSVVLGMVGLGFGAAIPHMVMKSKQAYRNKSLSSQIPDALDMLCSALRSGFSISRGLKLVETQMHPPISQEFGRVLEEVQYGISLPEALDGIVLRTQNYDMELLVAAIQTQLELGGNLAEVLENISGMVRERVRLTGEIAAATAEGRLSAGILVAMPFAIAVIINIVSPGYLVPLFKTPLGLMLVALGAVLLTVGGLILKKLITIDM